MAVFSSSFSFLMAVARFKAAVSGGGEPETEEERLVAGVRALEIIDIGIPNKKKKGKIISLYQQRN